MVLFFELAAGLGVIGYLTVLLNQAGPADPIDVNDDLDVAVPQFANNVVPFTPRFRCAYRDRDGACTAGQLGAEGACSVSTPRVRAD